MSKEELREKLEEAISEGLVEHKLINGESRYGITKKGEELLNEMSSMQKKRSSQ